MYQNKNTVTLIGCLVHPPELRYTQNGLAVFEITVAGEKRINTEKNFPWYHQVVVLGKAAEKLAEKAWEPGQVLLIEGAIEYNEWTTQERKKRSSIRVKAKIIEAVEASVPITTDKNGGFRLQGGLNEVTVMGHVTSNPKHKQTNAGNVCHFSLGLNERWKDPQGQEQQQTHWIDASAWESWAQKIAEAQQGDPLWVKGCLITESWTHNGEKRRKTKIQVSQLIKIQRQTIDTEENCPF